MLNGEPYAETGRELYDGKGGVIVAYQSSDGSAGAQKGRYHVGADCIGKARYSDDEVYTTFVSPDGDRIVFTLMPVAGLVVNRQRFPVRPGGWRADAAGGVGG